MIVIVPVFRDGHREGTVAGTIRLTQGIRALYGEDVLDFWNLEIFDRAGHNVYRSLVAATDTSLPRASLVAQRHIPVADHAWKLRLWPTPLMVATLRTAAPQRILTIGLLSTVILAIANFLLAQRQAAPGAVFAGERTIGGDRRSDEPAPERPRQRHRSRDLGKRRRRPAFHVRQ